MIEVKKQDGRWLVNGNKPTFTPSESRSLDALIVGARLQDFKIENEQKQFPDWGKILTDKN